LWGALQSFRDGERGHRCPNPGATSSKPVNSARCCSNGLLCRRAEHLFPRHAVKPCGATQSCSACRTGARLPALHTPAALGRPGQSIPALPVRRANPFAAHSLLRLGTGPSPPWLGRSPGRASTGHSPYSGSPPGALANLRLTRGEPVRPGEVPLALLLYRPHPCTLGASIRGLQRSQQHTLVRIGVYGTAVECGILYRRQSARAFTHAAVLFYAGTDLRFPGRTARKALDLWR
jgi:hypothetical protein